MRARRLDGVAYDGQGPLRENRRRRVNETHPGMPVVVQVDLLLKAKGKKARAFAEHRFVLGKAPEKFPDGELIEAELLGIDVDPKLLERRRLERERQARYRAAKRETEQIAA